MATRTALLNGNVINRDTDFSKYIEAVSEPGVIEGLAVSSTSVAIGKAFVKCERTNGDVIYAVVYNNSAQSISGNGDVYIEIPQELIDNGELAPEDGSDIAEIKVGTMPSKNALKLATKNGSTITDERNIIKKVGELNTLIETSNTDIEDLDERVEALEEAGAIDHLEESGLVGELYTLNDTLFKQYTPTLENSTLDCNVSNTSANKQIHIQRIGSGVASNQLKLKVKMVGSSTQNLIVEVRKGVQVTVTADSEAYWYGNQVIASGSISYSNISTSYAEKTVTLNGNFGGTEGEPLDIVVYMNTVNASNYYCVACDSTQYSEGFSYVAVNGSTRTRSKLIPYCVSDGFSQTQISKVKNTHIEVDYTQVITNIARLALCGGNTVKTFNRVATTSGTFSASFTFDGSNSASGYFYASVNGSEVASQWINHGTTASVTFSCNTGDTVVLGIRGVSSSVSLYNNTAGDFIQTKLFINMPKGTLPILPQEMEGIGEFIRCTLYGRHKNNTYYGGIITGTNNVVLTGNITLGNAVGFLEINYNGTIVKVPYYS